ncbi:hypothetical protein [Paenibacillus aceris]|uniref:Uncharacterized protein n=1 Tax=Paenibacillus aceris TaxID=869555 RepID=A0ABS4HQP0_9BACL|nr:hypothetical protein [Paenibacillus aceris]MBP1960928.1 hypothetical protein [Paenibacillus aceris]NHW35402.1 hypothetical protein [Paenibacillus aceris]
MNVANSFLVSLFVWLAILINGLVVFRFKPLTFWKEILMVSVFCSSISTLIQYFDVVILMTFAPPALAISCFAFLTGIRWVYMMIMITVGVTVSGLLEFGTTYVFHHFDIELTLDMLEKDYSLASWYFVGIHFVIVLTLYQKRLGFTSLEIYRTPRLSDTSVIFTLLFLAANSMAGIFIVFKQTSILYLLLFVFIGFIVFVISNFIRELRLS